MLSETKGAWSVSCAACPVVTSLNASNVDEARTAATAEGWMDQARRGKRLAAWRWLYPACRPSSTGTMGRSTPT